MPNAYDNLLNQINRKQAISTLLAALAAGAAAGITVLAADLPKFYDVTSPIGAALLAALIFGRNYLSSGSDKR